MHDSPMDVIPVIDLKQGQVVHAVAGQRDRYGPICSLLSHTARPGSIARAFFQQLGLHRVYVADLDALAGAPIDWQSLEQIQSAGLRILVDAGAADVDRVQTLLRWAAPRDCLDGIVVGLETLTDPRQLDALVQAAGPDRAVFSLDLRRGRPLAHSSVAAGMQPTQIAGRAFDAGFRRIIALDLAAVGTGHGPVTLALCRSLRTGHAWQSVISGGSVRDLADLQALQSAGCDSALVASALHSGTIGPNELRQVASCD